jgi:hypothetical protein
MYQMTIFSLKLLEPSIDIDFTTIPDMTYIIDDPVTTMAGFVPV